MDDCATQDALKSSAPAAGRHPQDCDDRRKEGYSSLIMLFFDTLGNPDRTIRIETRRTKDVWPKLAMASRPSQRGTSTACGIPPPPSSARAKPPTLKQPSKKAIEEFNITYLQQEGALSRSGAPEFSGDTPPGDTRSKLIAASASVRSTYARQMPAHPVLPHPHRSVVRGSMAEPALNEMRRDAIFKCVHSEPVPSPLGIAGVPAISTAAITLLIRRQAVAPAPGPKRLGGKKGIAPRGRQARKRDRAPRVGRTAAAPAGQRLVCAA